MTIDKKSVAVTFRVTYKTKRSVIYSASVLKVTISLRINVLSG